MPPLPLSLSLSLSPSLPFLCLLHRYFSFYSCTAQQLQASETRAKRATERRAWRWELLAEFFRCFLPSSYVDKVSHSVPGPPEASHYGAVCRSPTGRAETKARTTVKLFEVLCDNTKTDMLVTPHTSVASCWQRRCIPVLAQPCACAYDTITHGEQCLGLLGLQLLKTHGLEKGGAA